MSKLTISTFAQATVLSSMVFSVADTVMPVEQNVICDVVHTRLCSPYLGGWPLQQPHQPRIDIQTVEASSGYSLAVSDFPTNL